MARQSVSKHLAILEEADLVTTVWRGREKLHYLNAAPISEIAERWINRYATTYIRTTPEQLWRGLTDPAFTRSYWGVAFDTDWQVGSHMTVKLTNKNVTIADPDQVVLEADPYRRLSYTWHTFTPGWARAYDISDEYLAKATAEPRSKVTFEIEPEGQHVRLTVVHDGFEPGSTVLQDISRGWPEVISSLKSLLETGEPILA
jgi:uncharacterized protein YndB with AHSA1/START domain